MAKKLASKQNKRLHTEAEIRELGFDKGNFTTSWQGRVYVSDVARSTIAEKIKVTEKGEYAIKVR